MKAVLGDIVIAEAPKEDLIAIEGNWYFPPESINPGLLIPSATPYTCPWKGACQYFSVKDPSTGDGSAARLLQDQAWSYPTPLPSSFQRVGKDYTDYVAFWKNIKVVE
jgi:uncharacterized protein (DUF427 family)